MVLFKNEELVNVLTALQVKKSSTTMSSTILKWNVNLHESLINARYSPVREAARLVQG